MSKPHWPYLPSHRSLIPAALSLILLPAWSQDLPDGKGKELVAAQCNSCHTLASRVGAGSCTCEVGLEISKVKLSWLVPTDSGCTFPATIGSRK